MMADLARVVLMLLVVVAPAAAQQPVSPWPDGISYVTAGVNPAIALIDAWRSPAPRCRLSRLALSEAIGNGAALVIKHFVVSPRPCVGCAPDGMPSAHTMNSVIGVSARWQIGLAFAVETAGLRHAAHRHTVPQVLAGAALGALAESAGRLIPCPGE